MFRHSDPRTFALPIALSLVACAASPVATPVWAQGEWVSTTEDPARRIHLHVSAGVATYEGPTCGSTLRPIDASWTEVVFAYLRDRGDDSCSEVGSVVLTLLDGSRVAYTWFDTDGQMAARDTLHH